MTTHQDIPAADCRCGTREHPALDRACPLHGALAGPLRSYDDRQIGARLVSFPCCRRTVWAVRPDSGCRECR